MPTTIRVEFPEQSKCVVSSTKVESDEMSADEVLKAAVELALKAQEEARLMTLAKERR